MHQEYKWERWTQAKGACKGDLYSPAIFLEFCQHSFLVFSLWSVFWERERPCLVSLLMVRAKLIIQPRASKICRVCRNPFSMPFFGPLWSLSTAIQRVAEAFGHLEMTGPSLPPVGSVCARWICWSSQTLTNSDKNSPGLSSRVLSSQTAKIYERRHSRVIQWLSVTG